MDTTATIGAADALLLVDVQHDFLPGGALPVARADEVVPVLNGWIARFARQGRPVFATRDWHPPNHCSFLPQGPWPVHCVAGTAGAALASALRVPPDAILVDKGGEPQRDAYSGFAGTGLAEQLRERGVGRLFVGGLATDYCVLHTVEDAVALGFGVVVIADAVRAVDAHPGDGAAAIAHMRALGVRFIGDTA
jgi:nicotinamidase/pyrazinamidase